MNHNAFVIILLLMIGIACNPCKEDGYICSSYDHSSMIIDSTLYVFEHETSGFTQLVDRDSIIELSYGFSRFKNPGETHPEVQFGIKLEITFKITSNNTIEIQHGDVEFIKDGSWGNMYQFDSLSSVVTEYIAPSCSNDNGSLHNQPNSLLSIFEGTISRDGETLPFRFNLQLSSTLEAIESC